jgi:hypothetical protein
MVQHSASEHRRHTQRQREREREGHVLAGDVRLVAHEGDADVWGGKLTRFLEPSTQMAKGFSTGHVEDQQSTGGIAVIRSRL